MKHCVGCLMMFLVGGLFTGCGSSGVEDTVQVQGKVTLDGQALSGPTEEQTKMTQEGPPQLPEEYYEVRFSRSGENGPISYGNTIVLQGGVFKRELPPGKYQVTLVKVKGSGIAAGMVSGTTEGGGGGEAILGTLEVEVTEEGQELVLEFTTSSSKK